MRAWWKVVLVGVLFAVTPFFLGSGGCESPLRINEQTEVEIGQQAAVDIQRQYGVVNNAAWNTRIQRIGGSIARTSPRANLPWSFRVLNIADVNALALPGGPIYVTRGLMEQNITDNELAGVLGHEIAHVVERHSAQAIERAMTAQLLQQLILGNDQGALRVATDLAIEYAIQLPQSRQAEYESDAVGIRLMYNAGYNPQGFVNFLRRLQALSGPTRTPEWMRTHPLTEDRIVRAQQIVAQVSGQPRPVPVTLSEAEQKVLKELILEDQRNPITAVEQEAEPQTQPADEAPQTPQAAPQ